MGKPIQHTQQQFIDTLEIRVYKGADGSFNLYNDEGDTYDYEQGVYSIIPINWSEDDQTLIIGEQQGNFQDSLAEQVFNIVWVDETSRAESFSAAHKKTVIDKGMNEKRILFSILK